MGRLGKAMVDRIRALLGAGYSKTEVSKEMGIDRKTVSKYGNDPGPSLVQVDSGKVSLSLGDDITKILYDMMGVMGAPSIIGAVKQAYLDTVALTKLKVTHWPVYAEKGEVFTVESMIERLVNFIDFLETDQREWFNSLRAAVAEKERLPELIEERYEEGLEEGHQESAIYVPCAYCRKPYQVTPLDETHGALTKALLDLGWGHAACVSRHEYRRRAGSRVLEAEMMR